MSPSELVARRLGHVLSDAQSERLEAVLRSQVPKGRSLESWIQELSLARLQSEAWSKILESVLVPKTQLFRHPEQLSALRDFLRVRATGPQKVWSAACATGEEAFSLAACLGLGVEIVASDIGAHLLARAAEGRFPRADPSRIPARYAGLFLPYAGGVKAAPALFPRIRFAWSDLRDPSTYPPRPGGGWDAILCRNVLFYFQGEERLRILGHLARQLSDHGLLFLGPAEQVSEFEELETVTMRDGVYAYRRSPFGRRQRPSARLRASAPAMQSPSPAPPPEPASSPSRFSELLSEARALAGEDHGRALEALGTASLLADLDAEAHWAVARAYRELGELSMAVASFRRTLLLAPTRWEAAFQLAGTSFDLGRYREAEMDYARTRRLMIGVPDPEAIVAEADAACLRRIDECRRLQQG